MGIKRANSTSGGSRNQHGGKGAGQESGARLAVPNARCGGATPHMFVLRSMRSAPPLPARQPPPTCLVSRTPIELRVGKISNRFTLVRAPAETILNRCDQLQATFLAFCWMQLCSHQQMYLGLPEKSRGICPHDENCLQGCKPSGRTASFDSTCRSTHRSANVLSMCLVR